MFNHHTCTGFMYKRWPLVRLQVQFRYTCISDINTKSSVYISKIRLTICVNCIPFNSLKIFPISSKTLYWEVNTKGFYLLLYSTKHLEPFRFHPTSSTSCHRSCKCFTANPGMTQNVIGAETLYSGTKRFKIGTL